MFEGSRLQYVVPGYTGHIPKVVKFDPVPLDEKQAQYQIPGYAGYIPSIKSENIFAKTYGKITYNISQGDYHQGQDVPKEIRYNSLAQDTFVNQGQVLQRTAAEIVGVPNRKDIYTLPQQKATQESFWNTQQQQNQKTHQQQIDQTLSSFYGVNEEKPVKLGDPLPGYTGVIKRVNAANVFGQTYANARKSALQDESDLQKEKSNNFIQQAKQIPPVRR